ncbi:MAG TPA: hydroxyacylglutathione hydrolase [Polyangiaceae bacterium]|nr:hydroxyacylglutathione hydrolase [Polyangiaceae bacterium]
MTDLLLGSTLGTGSGYSTSGHAIGDAVNTPSRDPSRLVYHACMRVEIVPCLRDNYAYLVSTDDSAECAVIDPSEAQPIERALDRHGLTLTAILNTHHHHDHVGGNSELKLNRRGLDVFGHTSDRGRIPEQSQFLEHGQTFEVVGLKFSVMHIPGHTTGAIAYVTEGAVFTGDTLFAAGCGRLFEGTPRDMFESLNQKLAQLPDQTLVYCGHEYTVNNLRFAASLEPTNHAIVRKLEDVLARTGRGEPSVPSTLGDERATNPFMRTKSPELRASLGLSDAADAVSVLAATRAAKDNF